MNVDILIFNLTNPTLLFFILGIIAAAVKSDLEIPRGSAKFISLYLLFSIGFKGGMELAHSEFNLEILYSILFAILLATIVPVIAFFILKKRLGTYNAGAIAAAYGSVSAVTFVSADAFLAAQNISYGGHMVAIMALMESPAIVVGVILMMLYNNEKREKGQLRSIVFHSFTNGSVLMILGSLVIGLIADEKQALGIAPFTTDIFKGFLAIFLLDMGMITAKKLTSFRKYGWQVSIFAIITPIIVGCITAIASGLITDDVGNRVMFAILGAGSSYIAVPAAMRLAAPQADPGLYIMMALGITFPFNITIGIPLYYEIIKFF